jgi:hypothetical protein
MVGKVDKPEMAYLNTPQPVTDELLDLTKPVDPAEVFRLPRPVPVVDAGILQRQNQNADWPKKWCDGHLWWIICRLVQSASIVVGGSKKDERLASDVHKS